MRPTAIAAANRVNQFGRGRLGLLAACTLLVPTVLFIQGIRHDETSSDGLNISGVNLDLPDGRTLVQDISFALRPGDTALISGPSGSGKSTLFRAIAGIWPFGRGRVSMPASGRVLFLPQKPYLPLGTLREVVSYPTPPAGVTDTALREALAAVGLPQLGDRLDESANWALRLSPGEQQRIAFARALLLKPEWLFLDEATSAVDESAEERLYALLRARLPGVTLVSVGHRSSLRPFHTRRLEVVPDGERAGHLEETAVGA